MRVPIQKFLTAHPCDRNHENFQVFYGLKYWHGKVEAAKDYFFLLYKKANTGLFLIGAPGLRPGLHGSMAIGGVKDV